MTRVFLAAGVAALAIAAPASAGPHGGGKADRQGAVNQVSGQRAQAAERRSGGGGGGFAAQRAQRTQAFAPQRAERIAAPRLERWQSFAAAQRPAAVDRRAERMTAQQAARPDRTQFRAERQQMRAQRVAPTRTTAVERQQMRVNRTQQVQANVAAREQLRANRVQQAQPNVAAREQLRASRMQQVQTQVAAGEQLRANRAAMIQNRIAARNAVDVTRIDRTRALAPVPATLIPRATTRVIPVGQAVQYVGQPVSAVTNVVQLQPLPTPVQYLYPDTPDYYYQYGDGYLYQVDRSSSLIAALIPLLAGGFMPGQYLPSSYMNSYVPNYYGLNSFYPSSYDYGYGYGNTCNRYANGVIYQVDCVTGMVENVIPMYAGGYGVGQMLPSAYSYYNVPSQYRSMYYDTPDYNYWYAPGAIYQYDPSSSLITSVAALLSPGFTVGQPLPLGYDTYNVPYAYRQTYYDTPTAMYRYNNGYIYQVDPRTQLVSAIVASILT